MRCFFDNWTRFVSLGLGLWLLVSSNELQAEFVFGKKIKLNEEGTSFGIDSSQQPTYWAGGRWYTKDSDAKDGTWPDLRQTN